ncbi:unnamed protein product [Linum tenue]|uniref:Thiol-disulfide oxidoreductase DCC n=1 Tax=Linum tenue TaxID=586396 RepID=A0AAV0H360_9ROSI|nr:unnamed protein product [Linum tenue]
MLGGMMLRRLPCVPSLVRPPLKFFSYSSSTSRSTSSAKDSAAAISKAAAAGAADALEDDEELLESVVSVRPVTFPVLLEPRVVVYDGVCHLCHRGVKWVIQVDKQAKIKFCCVQSQAAEPYLRLCGLEREDVLRRFLFVEGPGLYHQGSTAALKVLSHLPLPYSALSSLLIVPAPLLDAVYDHVAKRRYDWFGKADNCLVLNDKELLDRFIDKDEMLGK